MFCSAESYFPCQCDSLFHQVHKSIHVFPLTIISIRLEICAI